MQDGVAPTPQLVAEIAARAAYDKKADDVRVLVMTPLTVMADYFVIASGETLIQVKTIADAVEDALAQRGIFPKHREWGRDSGWILLDYGAVVVHVFRQREREYYALEKLWGDAEELEWRVDSPAEGVVR